MGRPKGSQPKQKPEPGKYYTVGDPKYLASVLRSIVTRRYGGNWTKAAADIGLKPGSLYRHGVRAELPTGISKTVRSTLERLADEAKSIPLHWALHASSRQWQTLIDYWRWRDRRIDETVVRSSPRWTMASGSPEVLKDDGVESLQRRIGELHYVLGIIQTKYPDLMDELRMIHHARGEEDDPWTPPDDSTLPLQGLTPGMYRSLVRIVEPLLETRETAFIEPGWEELLQHETKQAYTKKSKRSSAKVRPLYTFIQLGIERERILLAQSQDDWERIRASTVDLLSDHSADWAARIQLQTTQAYTVDDRSVWLGVKTRYEAMLHRLTRRRTNAVTSSPKSIPRKRAK